MKATRKRYSSDLKAKVALDAIRGEMTLSELGAKHGIHPTVIGCWKRQATEGLAGVFDAQLKCIGKVKMKVKRWL